MRILVVLIIMILSTEAMACPPYILMNPKDIAPCQGIFLNKAVNEQVKKDLRDNEIRKKQIELKDLQIVEITSDREGWKTEANKQSNLNHSKDNDLRNGVIVGVLSTIALILVSQRFTK